MDSSGNAVLQGTTVKLSPEAAALLNTDLRHGRPRRRPGHRHRDHHGADQLIHRTRTGPVGSDADRPRCTSGPDQSRGRRRPRSRCAARRRARSRWRRRPAGSTGTGPSPRTAARERGVEGAPRAGQRRHDLAVVPAVHPAPAVRRLGAPGRARASPACARRAAAPPGRPSAPVDHVAARRPGHPEPRARRALAPAAPQVRAGAVRVREGDEDVVVETVVAHAATRRRPTRPGRGARAPGRPGGCRSRAACRRPRAAAPARGPAARTATRTGSARRARRRRRGRARSGSRSPSGGSGTATAGDPAARRARPSGSAAAASSANGLSETTASPSSSARSVSALWVSAGVEMATASAPAAAQRLQRVERRQPGVVRVHQGPALGGGGDDAEEVALHRRPQQWRVEPAAAEAVAHEPDPDRFHPCAGVMPASWRYGQVVTHSDQTDDTVANFGPTSPLRRTANGLTVAASS